MYTHADACCTAQMHPAWCCLCRSTTVALPEHAACALAAVQYNSLCCAFFTVSGLVLSITMIRQCGQCGLMFPTNEHLRSGCSDNTCSAWWALCVLVLLNAVLFAGSSMQWMSVVHSAQWAATGMYSQWPEHSKGKSACIHTTVLYSVPSVVLPATISYS